MFRKFLDYYRYIKRFILYLVGQDIFVDEQIDIGSEYHGSEYGGWVICPSVSGSSPIVYSAGIGKDITFDISIINKYDAKVFALDPTPESLNWLDSQTLPENLMVIPIGVAGYNGKANIFPPENPNYVSHSIFSNEGNPLKVDVKNVFTIMNKLGHKHVDILKLDIEGAEYEVIDSLVESQTVIPQLLIEFHHKHEYGNLNKTKESIIKLFNEGYRIAHVSPRGVEYTFVHVYKI